MSFDRVCKRIICFLVLGDTGRTQKGRRLQLRRPSDVAMNIDRHTHQLQFVQAPHAKHVCLPSSVPMSADGEEGASVYNRRLLQSNISAANCRHECQQIPPNRTVPRELGIMRVDHNNLRLHSQSTSISTFSSSMVCARSLTPLQHHPSRTPNSCHSSREQSCDYVSSSALSRWRCSLPVEQRPRLPIQISDDQTGIMLEHDTEPDTNRCQSQRSKSVDSMFRWFRRFTSKRVKTKTLRTQPSTSLLCEDFLDLTAKENEKGKDASYTSSHWELPPNYVDMIFAKKCVVMKNVAIL